jgi:hypothetical protein
MRVVVFILAAALAAAPAPAQPQRLPGAPDYAQDSTWLCLPGRKDSCAAPLPTTELSPSGYGAASSSVPAKDPPLDCFYVYPTVSDDPGMNSDLDPGPGEKLWTQQQFAAFSSVCRTFAPVYRQMTMAAIITYSTGADVRPYAELAFSDVLAAWRNYIRTRNQGRPFVLIGHSQGSLMLQMLIAREIEKDPAVAARMKFAIIPGYNVLVPQGRLVGGTFARTPLCSRPGETNCVIAWSSFRERNEPPPGAMFGYADQPGMTVGCVNPALPGSAGWVKLDSIWYTRSPNPVPGGPIQWSSQGQPSTAYVRTQGLVSGKCVNDGPRGYLSIRTNSRPGEKWTDHIGGEIAVLGLFLPGWGMHLSDIAVAQGDLIRAVGAIGRSK